MKTGVVYFNMQKYQKPNTYEYNERQTVPSNAVDGMENKAG